MSICTNVCPSNSQGTGIPSCSLGSVFTSLSQSYGNQKVAPRRVLELLGGRRGAGSGGGRKALTHGVRPAVGSCAPRALQRCQEWAAQGEPHSRTAGAAIAAIRTLTGSANNSCGTIFLFGQRGKGHCSQIGLFNNTCMHS